MQIYKAVLRYRYTLEPLIYLNRAKEIVYKSGTTKPISIINFALDQLFYRNVLSEIKSHIDKSTAVSKLR